MALRKQPLTDKELEAWESSRLSVELPEFVRYRHEKIRAFRSRICQIVWRVSSHLARLGATPP